MMSTHRQGVLVYLRQEGRNIGLCSKLRAYNIQDYGFDDVTANVVLGHGPDDRTYDIVVAILDDLRLGRGGITQ
jgi:GTP cyclohydrolase II